MPVKGVWSSASQGGVGELRSPTQENSLPFEGGLGGWQEEKNLAALAWAEPLGRSCGARRRENDVQHTWGRGTHMTDCRASIVTEFKGPLTTARVPIPDLEPSALLARVDAATLCGTDVHLWEGLMVSQDAVPYIPGHETAGTIVESNGPRADVLGSPLAVGDRIVWTYPRCGHCYFCRVTHQPTLCPNGVAYGRVRCDRPPYLMGGCAEYQYVPPTCEVIRIPDEVSSPLAASAACALRTVMHGFERLGALLSYEIVLVQGSGPVGLYAAAVARHRGAARILMIGAPAARLALATEWGVDATLNLEDVGAATDRIAWAREQTAGRGPDVVIQCAGPFAVPEGLEIVRRGGRYLSIGAGGAGTMAVSNPTLTIKQLQIVGVLSGQDRHYYQALEFLRTARGFPFERLISNTYPLEGANEALLAMADLREIKPVIVPSIN